MAKRIPKTPVAERLREYFQGMSDVLGAKAKAFGLFSNNSDSGIIREDILAEFLETHLPPRCKVLKGGAIFDSSGKESNQIDVVVANDLALQFQNKGKAYVVIEGCYAAISVKSELNKKELFDCLANLASIPDYPPMRLIQYLHQKKEDFSNVLPVKIVFAYSGINADTLHKHVEEYYKDVSLSMSSTPSLIIVNNKYCLVRKNIDKDNPSNNSKPEYVVYSQNSRAGSFSLFSLLTIVQFGANMGSLLYFDFQEYFRKMYHEKSSS